MSYRERIEILRGICANGFKRLRFLFYEPLTSESDMMQKHTKYVNDGYEGLMLRNLNSPYHKGRRSVDLLKYKHFEDSEFKITDVLEGIGSEKGAAIYECITSKGEKFTVRPRGSIEQRKEWFKNKARYIGKNLTVRYQPEVDSRKEGTLPRFPVGIGIRDYE